MVNTADNPIQNEIDTLRLLEEGVKIKCSYKDLKKLGKGSTWTVHLSEFNTDTQDGDVFLRPLTIDDI